MSNSLDTDIANYSVNDLEKLLGLQDNFTKDDIIKKSDEYLKKYKNQKDNNLYNFFVKVREKLLENLNKGLRQRNISHITESGRNIISREKLGLDETLPLNIGQDNLNQILRQSISRQLVVDSSFRLTSKESNNNVNLSSINNPSSFSINLTENLKNVISLRITGLKLPNSIKLIDNFYGNNFFFVEAQKNPGNFGVYRNKDVFNLYDYSITRLTLEDRTYASRRELSNDLNNLFESCLPDSIKNDLFCFPSKAEEIVNNKIVFVNTGDYYIRITFWSKNIQENRLPNVKLYDGTDYGFIFKKYLQMRETTIFLNNEEPDNDNEFVYLNINRIEEKSCGSNPTKTINLGWILGFRNKNSETGGNLTTKKLIDDYQDIENIDIILNPNQFNNSWYEPFIPDNINPSNNGKIINPVLRSAMVILNTGLQDPDLLQLDKDFWSNYPNPTQSDADNRSQYLKENWLNKIFLKIKSQLQVSDMDEVIFMINTIIRNLNNYYAAYQILNGKEYDKKNIIFADVQVNFEPNNTFYVTVDDFQTGNEVSRTVAINTVSNKLDLPGFKNKTNLEYELNENRTGDIEDYVNSLQNPNIALICDELPRPTPTGESMLLPSWPRTLTQNQIYAYNQISGNRKKSNSQINNTAPTFSNILGIFIPGNEGAKNPGDALLYKNIDTGIKRNYFGPVEIDRLKLGLYDSNGNLVNLNGLNWCVNLEAEQLYQY